MGTLHWVAFPPARQDLLQQLAATMAAGDGILLLEAGLLHARHPALQVALPALPCHRWDQLDAAELAALCAAHPRHLNWWP